MALYTPTPTPGRAAIAAYSQQSSAPAMGALQQYTPMVNQLARQLLSKLPANVALDDLVQSGMLGLMDAMQRFDPSQGAQFETFASQRVRGAMLDELRAADCAPRALRKQQKELNACVQKLQHRLGRQPKDSEIALDMGLAIDELQSLQAQVSASQMSSLEGLSGEDDDAYLDRHGPVDGAGSPDAKLGDARMRAALVQAINALPERDQQIMGMYYEHEMTLKEIAMVFGITESRVSQLHSQTVAKLRVSMREH